MPSPPVPATEAEAYRVFERLRWGGDPQRCPHCDTAGRCRYVRPRDGTARPTRTGSPTERRVWSCTACGRQFSVLTGTVLAGTRLPLRAWLAVADGWVRDDPPALAAAGREYGVSGAALRAMTRRLAAAAEQLTP